MRTKEKAELEALELLQAIDEVPRYVLLERNTDGSLRPTKGQKSPMLHDRMVMSDLQTLKDLGVYRILVRNYGRPEDNKPIPE